MRDRVPALVDKNNIWTPPPEGTESLALIDRSVKLGDGATKKQVTQAMQGHNLAEADLVGVYER